MNPEEKTVYFAGELFSLKHLIGNAALAEAIDRESRGAYRCVMPQDLEQRETTPQAIRDQDIACLLACDVAMFNFDGDEIDSGTVSEFMIAKAADIPAVIVRTDFRRGGDGGELPWNLMLSNYPRTKVILLDAVAAYQKYQRQDPDRGGSVRAAFFAYDDLAKTIVSALDSVMAEKAAMPLHLREAVYQWLRLMPGTKFATKMSADDAHTLLKHKLEKAFKEADR